MSLLSGIPTTQVGEGSSGLFLPEDFVPILSYGMGVESTAILVRWLEEPSFRDFDLRDLIVISAQTGDEWQDTADDVERHILPRLREHNIRYVQVARAGHSETDGIVVLDDSRRPEKCHIEGKYKLRDELRSAGTVPTYGGQHRCSLKFKAFVIERWMEQNFFGNTMLRVRHTFGYNADETGRVTRSNDAIAARARMTFGFNSDELGRVDKGKSYDRSDRMGHYPLVEWKWNRDRCLAYVKQVTGPDWQKSACWECPFTALTPELIARQKRFPNQAANAMALERLSLAMNPRCQLYKKEPLYQIVSNSGNSAAMQAFDRSLKANGWAVYRVRRVYQKKGKARRCVERVCECESESEALGILDSKAQQENLRVRRMHGLSYAYVRECGATYPTTEEY